MVSYKTPVTSTSATAADLGAGLTTGHMRYHEDGTVYVLLKAAEAIPDGNVVIKDGTSSTTITVIKCTAITDVPLGVNNVGAQVTSGHFFWALCKGRGYVAPAAAGWLDGQPLGPSATAGTAEVGGVGVDHIIGVAITDDDQATVGNNLALLNMP